MIGNYILTSTVLGKGQFGEVVLAEINPNNPPKNNAQLEALESQLLACKIIKK